MSMTQLMSMTHGRQSASCGHAYYNIIGGPGSIMRFMHSNSNPLQNFQGGGKQEIEVHFSRDSNEYLYLWGVSFNLRYKI